jgi:uncharacterized tellurite resistance protein B-like protein
MSFAFTAEDRKNLSADEKAAVVAACLASVAADGKIDPAEVAKFDAEFQKVPWGLETAVVDDMINLVYLKLQTIQSPAQANEFVARAAAALPSVAMKEKTIALAAKVAYVDGRVKPETANILNAIGAAMEIPMPRMQEIAAFVKDASAAT